MATLAELDQALAWHTEQRRLGRARIRQLLQDLQDTNAQVAANNRRIDELLTQRAIATSR